MRVSLVALVGICGVMVASAAQASEVECAGRVLKGDKLMKSFRLRDEGDEAMGAEIGDKSIVGTISENGVGGTVVSISIGAYKDGEMLKGASMVMDLSSRKALLSKKRVNEPTLQYVDGGKTYIVSCRLKGSAAAAYAGAHKR